MTETAALPRDARLHFRLDGETKSLIERAAALEGRRVTEFCLGVLASAARKTVEEAEGLRLSETDRAAFFDALAAPPPRAERLERAMAAHGRRVGRG